MNSWFDIDKDGFGQLMADRPKVALLYDLLQNVFDEDATTADVTLLPTGNGTGVLTVRDDCPDGFQDLRDAYTLYRPSKKKGDPLKRGRFNEGEKFVLSQCVWAMIRSTTGTVMFNSDGTRTMSAKTSEKGSIFEAEVKLTKQEIKEMISDVQRVIVPDGFTVMVNMETISDREVLHVINGVTLPTVRTADDGALRSTRRQTFIEVVASSGEETSFLYEMGIPVVEIDTPWHINVGQKIPLNRDRDNITPAYRRELLAAVLDRTVQMLDRGDASESWVKDALPMASETTVQRATDKMFGKGWVIGTPADREADKNAIGHGKTVVGGGTLSKAAWSAVREAGAASSSATEWSLKPERGSAPPLHAENTPFVIALKRYAIKMCKHLMGLDYVEVDVWNDPAFKHSGLYCGRRIVINLHGLRRGGAFKDKETFVLHLDDLLIHECAHKFSDDHLSMAYVHACTRLGALSRSLSTSALSRSLFASWRTDLP
jgi:hypothetical protein